MAAPSSNKFRTYVLTGSVAAITATGAWYGAGVKTRREYTQVRNTALEATPAERIQQMETAKARLLTQRSELQAKINRLTAKASAGEHEKSSQAS
ncbi:hypothetical protein LTR85_000403 [Meristemomyces frigidus]|nr:hypothetical protein LTR85_000403 [Meristemomyces frigidus]